MIAPCKRCPNNRPPMPAKKSGAADNQIAVSNGQLIPKGLLNGPPQIPRREEE